MPVPFFPLLGVAPNWTLLDPMTVFTPFTCGLVLLSSLCGLGIGMLVINQRGGNTKRLATLHATPPSLSKAA